MSGENLSPLLVGEDLATMQESGKSSPASPSNEVAGLLEICQ